jgi:hypothetical protein
MAGLEGVWQVMDAQVASGRIPGYVATVRIAGTCPTACPSPGS